MWRKWVWTGSLSSLWLPAVGKENSSIIDVMLLSCYYLGGWHIWSEHLPRLLVNDEGNHSRLGINPVSPVIIKTHYLWAMIASSLKH